MSAHISDLVRPDGRLLVRSTEGWTEEAAGAAAALANSRGATALGRLLGTRIELVHPPEKEHSRVG